MGAGSSAQSVQEHLDKQEECIKKIQAVFTRDGVALALGGGSPGGPGGYQEGDPEEGSSECSDYEDEKELARAILHREAVLEETPHPPPSDDSNEKDYVWSPPTAEESESLKYTKPWLLSTVPPTDWEFNKPERDETPDASLELEYVYGYRTRCCRNTLRWVSDTKAVYFAAKMGIVHDFATNTQQFFRGHSDNIVSLDFDAKRKIVATGQQGIALICVWDVETQKQLAKLGGFHKKAVVSLSFSDNGKYLASVGLDDHHIVAIYDWEAGAKLCQAELGPRRALGVRFQPGSNASLVTVGVKHLAFWSLENNVLLKKEAKLGKRGKNQVFLDSSTLSGNVIVGTAGGELYRFDGEGRLMDICYAHNGSIASLTKYGEYLISGGHDGYVCVWDSHFVRVGSVVMNEKGVVKNSVRSLDVHGDELLVGCVTSSMYTINLPNKTKKHLISYHCGDLSAKQRYGELWAVTEDPLGPRFATVCDDAMLRVWDSDSHECLHSRSISVENAGGPARSLCWSPDGQWIACGFLQGSIALFNAKSDFCEEFRIKYRKRRIQVIRFSPCSKYLAVGGADNVVDVYSSDGFPRLCECKGSTSVILSIDWSHDSKYLNVSTQDYFLKFFSIPDGACVDCMETRDCQWATQTSFLGWTVQGIWGKSSDGSDINSLSKSHGGGLLATADQYGEVNLFRHPCIGSGLDRDGALKRRPGSVATSGQAQVTNVAWHCKDTRLWTSGGEDMTVFQWIIGPRAK
eukprot:TRINITY_DN5754_c0_g1_i3.p1 TRINITY_DN5754_c0_g1~~TRINITY_DN5754_c0_g1_i3.p1  ORF type:complete len:745 (+),score=186.73 TRINITY_DN5754_c0_g1_i3:57-2291(+)